MAFFRFSLALLLSVLSATSICQQPATLANDIAILKKIDAARPLNGALIPADIARRLGATHVDGKYYFTTKPYLIEGAEKLHSLGMGVCKLWFYKKQSGYRYNSNWSIGSDSTLVALASHPYFREAFAVPFSTFVLSTGAGVNLLAADSAGLKREEEEYYQLTKYFLQQYKDRPVEFILSNWEGDWILRGGFDWAAQWGRVTPPADLPKKLESMRRCFTARQQGVSRARAEVKGSKAKVYHAIEINKVIDAMYGVQTLANDVLPHVEVDMVSWSAYDATDFDKTGLDLHKGIDYLRKKMRPTSYMKEKVVFLGEIGIPEMNTKNLPEEFRQRWDTYLAVCLAQKIPYFIQWELYCNEPVKGAKITAPATASSIHDLNGFWLIKPDGTKGYAMNYFDEILQHAGRRLPKTPSKK